MRKLKPLLDRVMELEINNKSFGDNFPKLSMQEMSNLIGINYDLINQSFYSNEFRVSITQPQQFVLNYFDQIGIDLSVYKQFENTWRYDITGRDGLKYENDMFIHSRKICLTQALICAFFLREKQLQSKMPQSVDYINGSVHLSFFDLHNKIIIHNQQYLEECEKNGGFFIRNGLLNGLDSNIRVIIENIGVNITDISVTLYNYCNGIETLKINSYFLKL